MPRRVRNRPARTLVSVKVILGQYQAERWEALFAYFLSVLFFPAVSRLCLFDNRSVGALT